MKLNRVANRLDDQFGGENLPYQVHRRRLVRLGWQSHWEANRRNGGAQSRDLDAQGFKSSR